ncbi:MAG: protein translocase subunit SecD [Candidatus Omnitrophica bacterium]|nr:protein translocase subunit SecD [Candidatus Omnitrophota bacterium]
MTYQKLTPWFLTILAVIGLSAYSAFPLHEKIALGLDLQGGMHLILRADLSKIPADVQADARDRALEVIRKRVDEFGVKEPVIVPQGKEEIVIQLPGITDRDRALKVIGRTAHLEFRLVKDDPESLKQALAGGFQGGDYELLNSEEDEPLLVAKTPAVTGADLTTAHVDFDQSHFNMPVVSLRFNAEGARTFAKVTAENIGKRLAIVLDGKVQSAPVIQSAIPDGQAIISGRFTPQQANDLALILRVGALPAPVYVEEERTVGPLLGSDSVRAGVKATAIGVGAVLVFMTLYYLVAGIIACLALMLNFLIILGGLGLLNATLTLPGIAGLVLSLGMAVDANVLVYERMREEIKLGRSIRQVIVNGYDRAFSAILDANITTLIAAFLLFQFGTGPVRGFAVTTCIGLTASLFTAIVVTRVIFEALHRAGWLTKIRMLQLIGQTQIDFVRFRVPCYLLSLVLVVGGTAIFFNLGDRAYGIDFTGGQIQQYRFQQPVAVEEVRKALGKIDLGEATIQNFGGNPNEVLIRTAGDTVQTVKGKISEIFPGNPCELVRVEQVGPSVGKDLRKRAVQAIFWALVSISIYVGFRFRSWPFGVAGIVALLHDVLIAVGALAVTGRPMSLTLVAGLLTIAGYSINDTIVIYDRIRELKRTVRRIAFGDLINLALNQTLSRTVLTTSVTLLTVVSIFLFGGEVLNDFAFVLLVGFLSGVYSTVFIATPLLLVWQKKG